MRDSLDVQEHHHVAGIQYVHALQPARISPQSSSRYAPLGKRLYVSHSGLLYLSGALEVRLVMYWNFAPLQRRSRLRHVVLRAFNAGTFQ